MRWWEFNYVKRQGNIVAHVLAHHAQNLNKVQVWLEEIPKCMQVQNTIHLMEWSKFYFQIQNIKNKKSLPRGKSLFPQLFCQRETTKSNTTKDTNCSITHNI